MKTLYKNWRTTLAALAIGTLTVLQTLHYITPTQFATYSGVLAAVGLGAAKDGANKNL